MLKRINKEVILKELSGMRKWIIYFLMQWTMDLSVNKEVILKEFNDLEENLDFLMQWTIDIYSPLWSSSSDTEKIIEDTELNLGLNCTSMIGCWMETSNVNC